MCLRPLRPRRAQLTLRRGRDLDRDSRSRPSERTLETPCWRAATRGPYWSDEGWPPRTHRGTRTGRAGMRWQRRKVGAGRGAAGAGIRLRGSAIAAGSEAARARSAAPSAGARSGRARPTQRSCPSELPRRVGRRRPSPGGVSTCRVDQLVESLGLRVSRSEVSGICQGLNEQVAAVRERPLEATTLPVARREGREGQGPGQSPRARKISVKSAMQSVDRSPVGV
jgi:mutator family transposase